MRIIKVKAFEYDELSDETKEKVVEDQRYINVRFNDWYETVVDSWKESLEEFGFFDPKVYFSGFYSQGDGACFDCESVYIDKIFDAVHSELENFSKEFQEQFKNDKDAIYEFMENHVWFVIESFSSRYCHENTRKITWNCHGVPEELEHLEKFINEIGEWLEEKRKTFCQEIYRHLESVYEHLTSDEAVASTLNCNEYEFLENGRLIDF